VSGKRIVSVECLITYWVMLPDMGVWVLDPLRAWTCIPFSTLTPDRVRKIERYCIVKDFDDDSELMLRLASTSAVQENMTLCTRLNALKQIKINYLDCLLLTRAVVAGTESINRYTIPQGLW
jgi:hypothetical protein